MARARQTNTTSHRDENDNHLGLVVTSHTVDVAAGDPVRLLGDLATQKIADLGISGSGKTYGAGKIVEILHASQKQFAVIDTVGNWYGLRLAADGTSPGIQIPVLGGDHGDIALEPEHGRLVAETLVDTRSSMVIDVSDFTGGELRKFIVDFSTTLLAAKKRSPSPLMVVWEECQEIVPQKVFGEDARMVGAVQKLIKKGRNYGVGTMLISQRAAAVNKEALNQCHTLLGFRVIGKLDRKAIEDWISDHGAAPPDTPMSELDTGTCVLWSPQWLKRRDVIRIGPKWTFDASATPDFKSGAAVGKLAPVDLEKFKIKMASAIQKADERDPDRLLAKIAELERKLQHADTGAVTPGDAELRAHNERVIANLTLEIDRLRDLAEAVHEEVRDIPNAVSASVGAIRARIETIALSKDARDRVPYIKAEPQYKVPRYEVLPGPSRHPTGKVLREVKDGNGHGNPSLSKMLRNLLVVLAQYAPAFPLGMSKGKVRAYADYANSGKIGEAWAEAVRAGYVESREKGMAITAAGRSALGTYTKLPTGDAYYLDIISKLDAMPQKLLRVVHDAYPREISKGAARIAAGYANSGKIGEAWALLMRRDYIVKRGGGIVRAADHLFDRPSPIA